MSDIDAICRRLEQARSTRGNWDSIFQEIGDRLLPQAATFTALQVDGAKRTELMYDAWAALALQKFSAAIESFATPRNQLWHGLAPNDEALKKAPRVKQFFEAVTRQMFDVRYSPRAAFATQSNEVYLGFGAFGTAGLFVDDDPRARVIRYKSLNLAGTWLLENHHGNIDTVFRQMSRTLRQLKQRWPDTFPQQLGQRLEKNPEERIDVLHVVEPRPEADPDRMGWRGMPWRSCYFLPSLKHELEEGGYRSWPFGIARYMTAADEVYGRSPAWLAMSNIKTLNEQKRTILRAAHKAADPPLLAADDGVLQAFSQVPGAINYGGIDSNGREMVKPLLSGARIDIGIDMMDREREIIGLAFLADVYRALVENPSMTATQALELINERAMLVAPVLGRLQGEFLGCIIEREIDILIEAGQLPEMPPELVEAEGQYRVEYTSPMARAMRAADGVAIARSLEAITPIAQIYPRAFDRIKLEDIASELWDINGAPAKLLRTDDEMRVKQDEDAQAQQTQQLIDAAPSVSSTIANLTKAQAAQGRPVL